jgi:hypothetical protein
MSDSAEIERLKDAVVAAAERLRKAMGRPHDCLPWEHNDAHVNLCVVVDALRAARRPKWGVWRSASEPGLAWCAGVEGELRVKFYGPTAEADARAYAKGKEAGQ